MSVQINVQASQSALAQSISQGVAAYNARFASQNQLNLQINPRSFSQPLGRITSDLADFESALKASNARVLAFGASTAVLGGAVKTFKELANITIEIEKSLTDVNRVLGLSTSGLQKFSSELFTISKQTASSFDDATKAALEFSRQGLNTEETLKRTADALTLVRLTGISSRQAVEDLTSTINGFSKAGLTTAQVVNKLAAVEQDFAVSASDLTEALSRTGQAAQEAGVDFDQLNALVTTAQQSTARGGAVIGNALKTIFTRLQRTDTLDQLEKFNIIVRDVEGNILPAVQILQNFANKYNDLADAQRAQLSEQVAGVYQVNILKGIVNDLTNTQGTYTKALERGAKASNEADLANQKLNKTLSALATQTGLGLQQLANNVGKVTFAPIFEAIVSPVNDAVKYINDTLEGEGPGSIFANGLLKGIRNVITGPGLAIAFAVIAKVAKNTFEDATKALPAILGLTTEAQKRANIEKSILSILQGQSQLSMALQGQQGNEIAQAQTLLNFAKLQTAQYQQQLQLAQQLAPLLSAQGATVGARGIQVGPRIKAGGHIPAFAEMSERMGAAMGGYKAGKVIKAPSSVGANTYMNTAEETKYVSGFNQPFINPPAGSKAGRAHRKNSINKTGIDPYMYGGFIPNFATKKDQILFNKRIGRAFEDKVGMDIGMSPSFNKPIDFISVPKVPSDPAKEYNKNFYSSQTFADAYSGTGHNAATNIGKVIRHLNLNYGNILKNPYSDDYFFDGKDLILDPNFTEIIGKGKDQPIAIASSRASSLAPDSKSVFLQGLNKKQQTKALKQRIIMEFAKDKVNVDYDKFNGFIPNFAVPMSTARIPWFKKYSSKYKDIAGDTDLFKMGDFPTYGKGLNHEYAKKGNANMLSYLHEDFVRSALNIALGSKKVIRPSEVGFKNKPIGDIANSNDFDLLYKIADGSYSMLELKQDFKNISGSISGFMNAKLENLKKENPELAKKVSSMIAVSNMPKFIDPTGKNPAGQFSEFEMAAASIVKDKYSNVNPTISAKLTKVTDGLLRRYEAKKNTVYGGFIPNFAYEQAVMGLEQSMSGNKAILDTKSGPFPFIRNSSQPNFASAISDHGGLKNALNDSMRNQEAAGLMSKGFVPNFATLNAKQSLGMDFGALTGSEQQLFVELNKALSRLTRDINLTAQEQAMLQNTVQQNAQALQQSTKSSTIVAEANNGLIKATQQNQNAQKKAAAASAASAAAALKPMPSRSVNPASINPNTISANRGGLMNSLSSMTNKLSGNVGFQIAVPMIAGQLESIIAQGRDRSEMSYGQRLGSTGVSAALTGASTGALIGSIIPGFGTALGAAVGAAVGFGGAMINARSNVDDFAKSIQNATQKDKEAENAVQGYTSSLKKLEEGGLTPKEREKTEKERQKYLLKIPAAIKAGINPNASSAEVEKTLEDLQISNDKREKVRNLQVLASSDLTKDQFDTARQTIAELSLVDKRFKNIADAITSSQTGEERAAFLAKGGGLEQQLSRSETFKSLKPEEQKQVIEGFRNAFAENTQGTIRASKLGTSMQDARQVAEEIKRTAPNNSAKKSASDIYLEIDKFLNSTAITLRQTLAEEEFADKFNELKTTFENSLVEGLISPVKSITAQTELKKSNLQNAYNREIKTANLDFTTKFADQIRSTPVLGSNPTVIQKLKDFTNKEGGATTAELEQFINEAPLMTIPPDTLQKIMKMISDQKALEKDKADNLSREKKNLDESGRQAILREELSRSANIRASQMGSAQMERNIILSGRQTTSEIQQAREDRYLNDVSNFYNMGMQRQSELRIGYRETATARNIQTFNANQLETANTNVLDAERLRITNEIATANAANNKQLADSLRKSPLLNQTNLENLETLQQTISEQEKYVKSLNGQGEQFTAANNSLTQLKRIQADIINNTKRETELLKIRNEEERKRVRDAKSFSVGLSAGFDDINKERETFANDFGQKIPGLFRDGLVGAMDAALNKADDLESALMGVAASFLREIQGMMLRNIANNIVGSIGSSFSFGQPKSAIEAGQQRGGFIRAQKGMYISGGRTGDKNPALLEDGEYVLNRNAVKSLGGPRAIDQLNFNAFPRFATGGDPGSMSASVNMDAPFERLSMYGREQSPEFQNYLEKIREEEAAKEKKRAERKALLNQFIGTLISTGVSMGISSAVSAAKNSSMANANLKGATGSMSNGTTTQVTNFADAKSLIDSGGSITLANGSVLTKSNFADGFSRSTFNEVAATRFSQSGIRINSGNLFRKSSATLMGKDYANQAVKENFTNPAAAFSRSQSIYEFTPYKGKQQGGAIGFNQGGFLPYGSRLTDSIPAYLTGGEYVVNSRAVRKYGVGGLNKINSGVARFQDGGMVDTETSSPSNTSNTSNNNVSINITVNASSGKVGDQESDSNNEGTEGNAKELSNRIKAVVLDVITTEQRTGGLLDSTKKR
jgi:TP901 family phage tail tape measure protein